MPGLPKSFTVAIDALGCLALIETVFRAEIPFVCGGVFASARFLRKTLIERAGVSVIAVFLGSRRANTVLALVVLRAFTAVLAAGVIERTQASDHRIAYVVGALVVVVADNRIQSLARAVNALVCLRTNASIVAQSLVVRRVGTTSIPVAGIDCAVVSVVAKVVVDHAVAIVIDTIAFFDGCLMDIGVQRHAVNGIGG